MTSSEFVLRDLLLDIDSDSFDIVILSMSLESSLSCVYLEVSASFDSWRLEHVCRALFYCPVLSHKLSDDGILSIRLSYDRIVARLMKDGDIFA